MVLKVADTLDRRSRMVSVSFPPSEVDTNLHALAQAIGRVANWVALHEMRTASRGETVTEKILFVDDEPAILKSMLRQLRGRFDVRAAESGKEALQRLKEEGPFAVIVSDMRMPDMNGIDLMKLVKDLYPHTVRLILTGCADQKTAMEAVNTGQIFRFLTKPCPPPLFITSLALALRQHRLVTSEQELLKNTLKGCGGVLSELLGMANPLAFSSGLRIKEYVVRIVETLRLPHPWQYEMAALLSQIGCITLPGELLNKFYAGQKLTPAEIEQFESHPETARKLLERIPRMENIAAMIALQRKRFDEYTDTLQETMCEEVLLGAQMLNAATDYDRLLLRGKGRVEALDLMRKQKKAYNPSILDALTKVRVASQEQVLSLNVDQVSVGMVAMEDVVTKNGPLIVVAKGQVITLPLLKGLSNFSRQIGIVEPIQVSVGMYAKANYRVDPDFETVV